MADEDFGGGGDDDVPYIDDLVQTTSHAITNRNDHGTCTVAAGLPLLLDSKADNDS